jgi:hypothetical protein
VIAAFRSCDPASRVRGAIRQAIAILELASLGSPISAELRFAGQAYVTGSGFKEISKTFGASREPPNKISLSLCRQAA